MLAMYWYFPPNVSEYVHAPAQTLADHVQEETLTQLPPQEQEKDAYIDGSLFPRWVTVNQRVPLAIKVLEWGCRR